MSPNRRRQDMQLIQRDLSRQFARAHKIVGVCRRRVLVRHDCRIDALTLLVAQPQRSSHNRNPVERIVGVGELRRYRLGPAPIGVITSASDDAAPGVSLRSNAYVSRSEVKKAAPASAPEGISRENLLLGTLGVAKVDLPGRWNKSCVTRGHTGVLDFL